MYDMKEKRIHGRVDFDGRVNFKIRDGDSPVFKADLINISHNGFAIFLTQDIHIEVENIIDFEIITPRFAQPLIGSAKIRHVFKSERYKAHLFRVGLEFIDVNKDIVLLMLKRHQVKVAEEIRRKKKVKPLDFMPY